MRIVRSIAVTAALALVLSACSGSAGSRTAGPGPTTSAAPDHDSGAAATAGEGDDAASAPAVAETVTAPLSYPVTDTGQTACYDEAGGAISCPEESDDLFGQDGNYAGTPNDFVDNGDGTVTDTATGLMWQQDPGEKMTYAGAAAAVAGFDLAGYDDWRLPTIKELYSLIAFSGVDMSGCEDPAGCDVEPFIDTDFFEFSYWDTSAGERLIDSQWATATVYESTTMGGNQTVFGVNLADGRIKGYPIEDPRGGEKTFFVIYVRGNPDYGSNEYVDNGDGTVSDAATGLMWQQDDSGSGMEWAAGLEYCEGLAAGGYEDWRLPDAKELQSIVDYGRSPDTTDGPAIDPIFDSTAITDEGGGTNWGYYWTSTTHASVRSGESAVYVAFGEALGWMDTPSGYELQDVHGAGAQRSDPKTGDASDYPYGHGPQGDTIRIDNLVRCVRGGEITVTAGGEVQASPAGGSDDLPPSGSGGPLAEAAALLGVDEYALARALGDPAQGPPDVANAASVLGLTEEEIWAVLPAPSG